MIEQTLGIPIDIHGGGNDLIFPHHENELAQGVCAHGHAHDGSERGGYANYWLHNGFLNMGSEKMSKSLGNVQLVHDLVKTWPGEALRWALLSAHYRQPLTWNDEVIEQARGSLDKLYGVLRRTADIEAEDVPPNPAFLEAMLDDLNTPKAYAELHALGAALEKAPARGKAHAKGELLASARLIGFLGGDPEAWFQRGVTPELKAKVDDLVAQRTTARAAKDWAAADSIRDELNALNVEVMDSAAGATWRLKGTV
jgi:cysteinyl-tRNA synthetase